MRARTESAYHTTSGSRASGSEVPTEPVAPLPRLKVVRLGAFSWLPVAFAPKIVVLYGGDGVGVIFRWVNVVSELEEKRVPGITGNIHLTAQSEFRLRIVLVHAVYGGSATKAVTRI